MLCALLSIIKKGRRGASAYVTDSGPYGLTVPCLAPAAPAIGTWLQTWIRQQHGTTRQHIVPWCHSHSSGAYPNSQLPSLEATVMTTRPNAAALTRDLWRAAPWQRIWHRTPHAPPPAPAAQQRQPGRQRRHRRPHQCPRHRYRKRPRSSLVRYWSRRCCHRRCRVGRDHRQGCGWCQIRYRCWCCWPSGAERETAGGRVGCFEAALGTPAVIAGVEEGYQHVQSMCA